jgi:hypothetical protein
MVDFTDSHENDSELVVLNIYTGNFVDYELSEFGEVILRSFDPVDKQDSCILTTWKNIYNNNLQKGKRNDSKSSVYPR